MGRRAGRSATDKNRAAAGANALQSHTAGGPASGFGTLSLATEDDAFQRSIDLLTRAQGDKLISGLVFMAVWHNDMQAPGSGAVGVRELARRLNLPYETVRRHAMKLVRADQCSATREGIAVVPAVLKSRANVAVMRKIYFNTERMLVELTRARVAKFHVPPGAASRRGNLTPAQMSIATASTGQLIAGIRMLGNLWHGDLLRGLVFTAIWTANVKHVTNTAPAVSQTVLPDELRLPVSVLAISSSLRLPYETVRRQLRHWRRPVSAIAWGGAVWSYRHRHTESWPRAPCRPTGSSPPCSPNSVAPA